MISLAAIVNSVRDLADYKDHEMAVDNWRIIGRRRGRRRHDHPQPVQN